MFYSWHELSRFIDATPFEIFLFLLSLAASSLLLTVKLLTAASLSWWTTLSPVFLFDAASAYFCVIILIRQYQTGAFRAALLRAFFSLKRISLLFVFKLLLCAKLDDHYSINYSEVFLPLFYIAFLLMVRAFRL